MLTTTGMGLNRAVAQPVPATIEIAYLSLTVERSLPDSYLDQPPKDEGLEGARLASMDNQTTGQFLGQSYHLNEASAPDDQGVIAAFKQLVAAGDRLFVTDLPAPLLLKVADLPEAKDVTILDATAKDDSLRGADCRRNTLHTMPSRAMLADALMQYMVLKKWSRIVLVIGGDPADKLYADAIRNSAHKFRIKIVQEIPWNFDPGARRTDTGHYDEEALAIMTSWSSPTRRIISVTSSPIAPPSLGPWPEPRVWSQPPGRGLSINGARRSCRVAFSSSPSVG
jgi:hypothetical protein